MIIWDDLKIRNAVTITAASGNIETSGTIKSRSIEATGIVKGSIGQFTTLDMTAGTTVSGAVTLDNGSQITGVLFKNNDSYKLDNISQATITNAIITDATITTATITNLTLNNPVTLPAGSRIEGTTVTDLFNCNLILYGKKVENNYQVWPANVSSLSVIVTILKDSGEFETIQLNPYTVSTTKVMIGSDRDNIQIQYRFGLYAEETSPIFTLPQSADDTRIGICHSQYAKEVLPWLRQIISYDSTTKEVWLLYSIFDDYQTGQRQLSGFQAGNDYKIGLGNCFPSLSQQDLITTWGTDIYDGKVYGPDWEARLPAGGIIGFKPKS